MGAAEKAGTHGQAIIPFFGEKSNESRGEGLIQVMDTFERLVVVSTEYLSGDMRAAMHRFSLPSAYFRLCALSVIVIDPEARVIRESEDVRGDPLFASVASAFGYQCCDTCRMADIDLQPVVLD